MPLVAMHWEHRYGKIGNKSEDSSIFDGTFGHAATLNVYTHVGLEDAEKELYKMQSMEDARKEMGLSDKDDRPLKQNMFKVE